MWSKTQTPSSDCCYRTEAKILYSFQVDEIQNIYIQETQQYRMILVVRLRCGECLHTA
jgi:hypothetical protein